MRAERVRLSATFLWAERDVTKEGEDNPFATFHVNGGQVFGVSYALYRLRVANIGMAPARHVVLYLSDADGVEVAFSGNGVPVNAGDAVEFGLVDHQPDRPHRAPLRLRFQFLDWASDEPREQPSTIEIPVAPATTGEFVSASG
jgi:hypothetical protein